jgi:cell division protein ZapA
MAEVNLAIHGKPYGIACDDGQEDRVVELGKYVDSRLSEIASAGAASNDSHLLVLTALVMADEIYELRDNIHELQATVNNSVSAEQGNMALSAEEEQVIINAIGHLRERIDKVAGRIQSI